MANVFRGDFREAALTIGAALGTVAFAPGAALSDQAGVSYWAPGSYASWSASPDQPGFSFTDDYTHTSATASSDIARALALRIGEITPNLTPQLSGTSRSLSDTSTANLGYVFTSPVFGGQAAINLSTVYGRSSGVLDANLNATLTGSAGSESASRFISLSSDETAFGDLGPSASLKWKQGNDNLMIYVSGGIPVGAYNPRSLANIGLGFWSVDSGGGYTYYNETTGYEFSAVSGFTYNFINPSTQYQNGIDFHTDLAAAKTLSDNVFVGAVGFIYDQVTGDSGPNAVLGSFESRVFGAGPQLGFFFPVGNMAGFLNLRAYYEFGAEHRPAGWNGWVTFALSPPDPDDAASTSTPRRTKNLKAPAPASAYNWNGFYIGANLGAASASGTFTDSLNGGIIDAGKSGFTGGGQLGYNYQIGSLVVGAEWLFDGTQLNVSGPFGAFPASANTNGISTLAARFGWAVDNSLLYGKLGSAWSGTRETLTNAVIGIQESGFRTSTGWTVGAGIEYALTTNWTAKLEYDYLAPNAVTYGTTQLVLNADQLRLNRQINMLTIGMNYKWPQ